MSRKSKPRRDFADDKGFRRPIARSRPTKFITPAHSTWPCPDWNCRHLANAQILRRLEREAIPRGWTLPTVCTPLELMGDSTHETESDS